MERTHWASDLSRVSRVVNVLSRHGFDYWLYRHDIHGYLNPLRRMFLSRKKPVNPYENLRMALEELGGTYVKLGQLLSIRPDLVPVQLSLELQKLQDRVPPEPFDVVKRQIESELKKPLDSLFRRFDKKPLAAASIGQVHRAQLKNGEEVVIKVQRPRVRQMMQSDIDIMRYLAGLAERRRMTIYKFSPSKIIDEFERYSTIELDYVKEGRHAEIFKRNVHGDSRIIIPKIYWEFTTAKVLTMQYVDGKKLSELGRADRSRIRSALDSVAVTLLKQVFEDGFFHADLHPGNILLTKDNRIAFLDFGIVGRMDAEERHSSMKMFVAILKCDADATVDALLELGSKSKSSNIHEFRREVREELEQWYGSSLGQYHVTHLMHKFLDIAYRHEVVMPPDLTLFAKALVTMEGTALEFDPEFDFVKAATPYMRHLMHKRYAPRKLIRGFLTQSSRIKEELVQMPRNVNEVLEGFKAGKFSIDVKDTDIHRLGVELDRSSNRLAYGMIIGALILAAALLADTSFGPRWFGYPAVSTVFLLVAFFMLFLLVESIRNEKKVERSDI